MGNEMKETSMPINNELTAFKQKLEAEKQKFEAEMLELQRELEEARARMERNMNVMRQLRANVEAQLYHRERRSRPNAGG